MVLGQGCSQRNRAVENAWRRDLRNEISDKPWISLAAPPRIVPPLSLRNTIEGGASPTTSARTLAIGRGSKENLTKPTSSIRKEIWQSKSPQQLLDVHDFMKQGCADRIRTFSDELEVLNSRNATIRQQLEALRKEATTPGVPCMQAIADAVQEPREGHPLRDCLVDSGDVQGERSNSPATQSSALQADTPAIAG